MNLIMTNKGWCSGFKCRDFPYALPEPESLTLKAKKLVEAEIDLITKAKWEEPSPEDYKIAQDLSQRSDGSRTPKAPAGGLPV